MRITLCGLLVNGNIDTTALLCESAAAIAMILLMIADDLTVSRRLLYHGKCWGRLQLRLGLIDISRLGGWITVFKITARIIIVHQSAMITTIVHNDYGSIMAIVEVGIV